MLEERIITINPIEIEITPELVNLYAEVSGDYNRLHVDEEYARTTSFGTRIAHGMLLNALVTEMLAITFGPSWAENGHLEVAFVAPVPIGSIVRTYGEITGAEQEPKGCQYSFKVWADINNAQKALIGSGGVLVSSGTWGK